MVFFHTYNCKSVLSPYSYCCDCIIIRQFNFKLIFVKNKTAKPEGKFGNERNGNNLKTIKVCRAVLFKIMQLVHVTYITHI